MSDIQALAEVIQQWHGRNIEQIDTILNTPKATAIRLGDDITLTGEQAEGFRMAAIVIKSWFEKLPFTISVGDYEQVDLEDEHANPEGDDQP